MPRTTVEVQITQVMTPGASPRTRDFSGNTVGYTDVKVLLGKFLYCNQLRHKHTVPVGECGQLRELNICLPEVSFLHVRLEDQLCKKKTQKKNTKKKPTTKKLDVHNVLD